MSKDEKSGHGHGCKGNTILTANADTAKRRGRSLPILISMRARVIVLAFWVCLQLLGVGSSVDVALGKSYDAVVKNADHSVATDTGGPSISFPESAFDFGTIPQGTKVSHTFAVRNTGNKPLKIIRAKSS